MHCGIETVSLSPWHATQSTGFWACILCGVSAWHFLQSTSFAVSEDAVKLISAAYATVVTSIAMIDNKHIILSVLIPYTPFLFKPCSALYIILSFLSSIGQYKITNYITSSSNSSTK